MNEIKSLADHLREKRRTGETESDRRTAEEKTAQGAPTKPRKPPKRPVNDRKAVEFFQAIDAFKLEGTEKSLIRVDSRTMNLLKRIKLAKGVDMNRFIVYALHQYIGQHPWLPKHIQETLKNSEP